MSGSSKSQPVSEPVFQTNKCSSTIGKRVRVNPATPESWSALVRNHVARSGTGNQLEPELDVSHHYIHLSGANRWKAGNEKASGSALHLEHFLHLRALVQRYHGNFPLRDLVEPKYADAAEGFLTEWPDFRSYIDQVHVNDPAMDLDSLGEFSGPKRVQNQVLLDSYLGTIQDTSHNEEEGDSFKYSTAETPLKKGSPDVGVDFNGNPTEDDAADEQIVNEALISFASVLTRRWMVQRTSTPYATDATPSKGSNVTGHGWRTAADWTMSRDRFHIRARCRQGDRVQAGHMTGLKDSSKRRKDDYGKLSDGHEYGRIFTSEIDGSLYSIGRNSTEILAIVEVKKRLREKNRLAIEWQEASEILAWLNMRLRDEAGANGRRAKGSSTARRGMLKSKPATGASLEKSRCLLVAQDREEIYLVIGEWDKLYEEYALEGKFSGPTINFLERLHKQAPGSDAGFLTLQVYGPYGSSMQTALSRGSSMRDLSTNLLALSLHLSQASCSPLSRRPTPPASIKLPTPRGDPCCPGCTCGCGCGRPPGGPGTSEPPPGPPGPPKPRSETSETRKGGQHGPREGSVPKDPSKKTPSVSSNSSSSSGRPDPTPSRAPRPGGSRPDQIRGASAHARDPRQKPGPVQAQGHGILPMRGRPLTSGQQGARSESDEQASRSRSRTQAAAAGQQGQGPAPVAGSRHPPVPQAPGGSAQVPGQQRQPQQQQQQQQGQRDPRAHAATSSAAQHQGGTAYNQAQQRPQTRAQTAGHHSHQPYHDPASEPGPSHPTQAGPSSQQMPARPARLELAKPSQTQQNPEDQSAKPEKKNPLSPKNFMSKIIKPKKDKKGKGPDDNNDKGDGGKK